PAPGRIETLRVPGGPGIRDDGGVYEGYVLPIHYDPLISKLIAWGETRDEAMARMLRALDEYLVEGVPTTLPFHQRAVRGERFQRGDLHTGFVEEMAGHMGLSPEELGRLEDVAVIAAALATQTGRTPRAGTAGGGHQTAPSPSAWKSAGRRRAMEG